MKLKIYQIFHDNQSLKNCSNSKYITKLCVGNKKISENDFEAINNNKYNTNQLSESRAFCYAVEEIKDDCSYIGFTSHKHNVKFGNKTNKGILFDCIKIEDLNYSMVRNSFLNKNVKLISFLPTINFIYQTEEQFHPGMIDFIMLWMKKEFKIDNHFEKKIKKWATNAYAPYSNAFIMNSDEFKKFYKFFNKFINYIDKNYNINEYSLDIPVIDKSRGWGYFCERIITFYLFYEYNNKFKIAFINKEKNINILN